MEERRFSVPGRCHGCTLRDFLRRELGLSARVLTRQKKTEDGLLRNGAPCRADERLAAGDVITLRLAPEGISAPGVERPMDILWETPDLLAVNKPAGMPVHPSPGHDRDSLLNAMAWYYEKTGQAVGFRPLYRLDKDTSGLLVLAKNRLAAGARVDKTYFALCQGTLSGEGVIDRPIGLALGSKIRRQVGEGQRAVTHWQALEAREGHTLLALRLETGRTHQIRVHLAWLGHPLAGDDLYGGSRERISRQALHCGLARVRLPLFEIDQQLETDFPPDLREAFPWLPKLEELREE